MNIFKGFPVFKNAYFRALTPKILRFNVMAPRKASVLTHRNELLPFTINNLWDNPGSSRTVKKLGRGLGTGKGKTAGKGYKGQRARAGSGVSHRFEGGESGFHRRMPKFGCPRRNRERPVYVNLSKIVERVKKGRLDNSKIITIKDLYEANLFKKTTYGVKILSRGIEKVDIPLNFEVTDASKRAIDLIKAAGGSVICIFRTRLKVREHLKPEKFPINLDDSLPSLKSVKKYERIRDRGADVKYNEPSWVKNAKEKNQDHFKQKSEEKKEEEKPIEVKIRKRKPPIYRTISLKLN